MASSTNANADNYPSLGTKSALQIRSLISIVRHWHKFELLGNTLTANTGTKGPVYLDFYPRTYHAAVIADNTFTRNGGYLDGNVIFVRARGANGVDVFSETPSAGNLFCTGYRFEGNAFTNNLGCSTYGGGAVSFECVNYAQA